MLKSLGFAACMFLWILGYSAESSKDEMNDISFKHYVGFEKEWKLVTVRYRNDNRELRFVYSNDKAWKSLTSKQKKFPDGAILAKVAYLIEPDPSFETSLSPAGTRRIQFMVKDQKKYKEQRGWGYALFDQYGKVNPEPVKEQINACVSCHDIVPERDYVFSWPMNEGPSKGMYKFELPTVQLNRINIPKHVLDHLPPRFMKVLSVNGELTKNVFQGTLDELKPAMAKLSVTKKIPVLFMNLDQKKFTLVYPEDLEVECDNGGVKGLFVLALNSMPKNGINKVHFCQSYY